MAGPGAGGAWRRTAATVCGVYNGWVVKLTRSLIDEVEIHNRALSEEEIQDIFNAGGAGKCKRCSSTITTIAGLRDKVDGLITSPKTKNLLTKRLNKVENALVREKYDKARTQIRSFIDKPAIFFSKDTTPDGINKPVANDLICAAANILSRRIPLR